MLPNQPAIYRFQLVFVHQLPITVLLATPINHVVPMNFAAFCKWLDNRSKRAEWKLEVGAY